jgi:hypothetical protein
MKFMKKQFSIRHFTSQQATKRTIREYFYEIDELGLLYLEETKAKLFTTAFNDMTFLDFFFKRLEVNATAQRPDYPFISKCGNEMNYIKTQGDTPIVFTSLIHGRLHWNNCSFNIPFNPSQLYVSNEGRIYHPSPVNFTMTNKPVLSNLPHLALVKSSIALELLGMSDSDSFQYNGNKYSIQHADFQLR